MDEKQIIETVETVTDAAVETVVPEALETIEVVKNNPYILVGVALVAGSTAFAIGYNLAEKRAKLRYDTILEVELDRTKAHYERRIEDLEGSVHVEEPEVIVNEVPGAERLVDKYGGVKVKNKKDVVEVETETVTEDDEEAVVVKETTRNIFVDGKPLDDDFDYELEMKTRTKHRPFVISSDEFFENDEENSQITVSYFAGDDILSDEEDRVIDDVDSLIGTENLKKFGHGSKDPRIVYIRNPKTNTDYEVALSDGSYAQDVLGLDE